MPCPTTSETLTGVKRERFALGKPKKWQWKIASDVFALSYNSRRSFHS